MTALAAAGEPPEDPRERAVSWYPWLESKNIAKRTAARWMEFAREVEIGQIGRFESVKAALKSVESCINSDLI